MIPTSATLKLDVKCTQNMHAFAVVGSVSDNTYIYRVIQNECQGTIVQRQFHAKFGKQPPSATPFEGGMHSFKRQGVCVSWN
jgi:hypothetical protein